jgi:hypothetical protein
MVKNNDSRTVIKPCGFAPALSQSVFEKFENRSMGHSYNKEMFIKRYILPQLYPESLIDPNSNELVLEKEEESKAPDSEDISLAKNVRC